MFYSRVSNCLFFSPQIAQMFANIESVDFWRLFCLRIDETGKIIKRIKIEQTKNTILVIYQWNIFEFVYSWQLQGRRPFGETLTTFGVHW
jgi:hypothetical protein